MDKGLNADEVRICELMGVNPHAYIEAREEERVRAKSLNQEAPKGLENKIASMMGLSTKEASQAKDRIALEAAARAPLTPDEVNICNQLGVEPLDYQAQKMADAGLKPQLS